MKKTKRFISLLLVVQMILVCSVIPGAVAADEITGTPVEGENTETVLAMPADTEIPAEGIALDELVPIMASGCHGETWTDPRNLTEQLALEAAMADPTIGVQLPIILNNPLWPSSAGWYKYQYSGNGFNLHYVYNVYTGESADFKFVLY